MKIYTRTGDAGETGLLGGVRVRKDDARIEAYGTVDELNAALGVARSHEPPAAIDAPLARLQHELFHLGAELASANQRARGPGKLGAPQIAALERAIDEAEAALPPLAQFILPGGTPLAAQLHLARTICRRAERRVIALASLPGQQVSPELVVYLNRASDLLFVLARAANRLAGRDDVVWQQALE